MSEHKTGMKRTYAIDRLFDADKKLVSAVARFHVMAEHAKARVNGKQQPDQDSFNDTMTLLAERLLDNGVNYARTKAELQSFVDVEYPDFPSTKDAQEMAKWFRLNAGKVQQFDTLLAQYKDEQVQARQRSRLSDR